MVIVLEINVNVTRRNLLILKILSLFVVIKQMRIIQRLFKHNAMGKEDVSALNVYVINNSLASIVNAMIDRVTIKINQVRYVRTMVNANVVNVSAMRDGLDVFVNAQHQQRIVYNLDLIKFVMDTQINVFVVNVNV